MNEQAFENILGTDITVITQDEALAAVRKNLDVWRGRYIVACNVHAVVTAHDDATFRAAENGAVMALPDGKPLCLVQRWRGHSQAGHVPITALMEAILSDASLRDTRHYFYGSTAETQRKLIAKIQERYPNIRIVGSEPSVFRPLSEKETNALLDRMHRAVPDFIWIGLGVPRQERLMSEIASRTNALMLGVGGGFDVLSGNVKRAPYWMQRLCLEWLYRLLLEPKRLFKRYCITNTRFIWLLLTEKSR